MNAMTSASLLQKNIRVLLIEDDPQVSQLVADNLANKGYQVEQCFDGESGLTQAVAESFQLILLDVMLPELDGLTLLSRLREHKNTPVIVLSACGGEQDRINGFNTGADDYLPKPFSMQELEVRMAAVLRRCYQEAKSSNPAQLCLDELHLNRLEKSLCIYQQGIYQQSVDVTPIEFELLWQLMKSPEDTLSRPYLYQSVLNRAYSRYDRSLDMHISNLRQKIKQVLPGSNLIRTIRGQGYRYQ